MSLLLKSNVAGIDCNNCYKWIYNLETGKPLTYEIDDEGGTAGVERLDPPPCGDCPKGRMNDGQPDFDDHLRLHRRNHMALKFYQEQKVMQMLPIPSHFADCPIFAENMRTIHTVLEEAKAERIEASDGVRR